MDMTNPKGTTHPSQVTKECSTTRYSNPTLAAATNTERRASKAVRKPAPRKLNYPTLSKASGNTSMNITANWKRPSPARSSAKFKHVEHLTALTKRLVELSHPDHKASVETGANRVNQSLTEAKQSAETGSELVLKNNFDAFAKSLNELEQQMKKQ